MKHRRTGAVIGIDWQPEEADLPLTFSQVETRVNPAWAAERAARAKAFATGRRIQVSNRTPQTKRAEVALKTENGKRKARSAKARFYFREGLTFYADSLTVGT